MATHRLVEAGPGQVWARALGLWAAFAAGTYTSWAQAYYGSGDLRGVKIDVGLPGGGTDSYILFDGGMPVAFQMPLRALVESQGFHGVIGSAVPTILPSGANYATSYGNGPWRLRWTLFENWCNGGLGGSSFSFTNTKEGFSGAHWIAQWVQGMEAVADATIVYTTDGTDEALEGTPTDGFGKEGAGLVIAGGGGAIDLTPVVTALQDISMIDVDYTANNGQNTLSVRGKVRT